MLMILSLITMKAQKVATILALNLIQVNMMNTPTVIRPI